MADDITGGSNTERIHVEVEGSSAQQGFASIGAAAASASNQINQLGQVINQTQGGLGTLAQVAGQAARGLNQAGQGGNQAAQGIANAGNAANNATTTFNRLQQSLFGHRGIGTFIWDMAIDGFKAAMGFAEAFIERTSAVQRTMSLLATVDRGGGAGEQFEYLTKVANNYGLSLKSIQDDYAKLNLAASTTALTSEQVRRVFEQVSMSTRTLHLNQQQTQLTFLAVEQMLSKGKISMEELRKQLAERLPGAMQALARELGVSYQALEQFITKVGASSEKIVPELGNALQRLYQEAIPNAAKALDAEKNRLETSVAVFFKDVVVAGGTEGMSQLIKSINSLLQVDTISKTFADAMNRITTKLAEFLSTLRPQDIEKFAEEILKFLEALAGLAMAAAKSIMFLLQHLTVASAVFGALVGATAGAPFGPIGIGVGAVLGGAGGAAFGHYAGSGLAGQTEVQANMAKMAELDKRIDDLQKMIDQGGFETAAGRPKGIVEWGKRLWSHTDTLGPAAAQKQLAEAQKERARLLEMNKEMATNMIIAQSPTNIETPVLSDLREMMTDPKKMAEYLKKYFGLGGEQKKTAEQKAAERLAERQQNFYQDVLAKFKAIESPETDKYEALITDMRQLKIPEGSELWNKIMPLIRGLQEDYNKKQQEKSKLATEKIEQEFDNFKESAFTDVAKFGEKYDIGSLQQIDNQAWATKAKKMGNELEREILSQQKRWDEMARKNPLFNFGFDRDEAIKQMREMGQAYIDEFKRIEVERRTIMGGAKAFLTEWNEMANNLGAQSKEFFKGITDNVVDMLVTALKTGEFSFKKLGEFMLDYIMKMMIIRAITPFINMAIGAFSPGAAAASTAASASSISSMQANYTLSSGAGGLGLRASGGAVQPNQNYIVGERGPEIFRSAIPGNIVPNSSLSYIEPSESLRGGQVNQVNVQVNIDKSGNADANTSSDPGAADLGRKIAFAVKAVLVEERRPGGMLA